MPDVFNFGKCIWHKIKFKKCKGIKSPNRVFFKGEKFQFEDFQC